MSKSDNKKKEMAKKMDINMGSADKAKSNIPSYLQRVGKNATGKDTITNPGKNNQSSRKMP
jgi:hypothetical protein